MIKTGTCGSSVYDVMGQPFFLSAVKDRANMAAPRKAKFGSKKKERKKVVTSAEGIVIEPTI